MKTKIRHSLLGSKFQLKKLFTHWIMYLILHIPIMSTAQQDSGTTFKTVMFSSGINLDKTGSINVGIKYAKLKNNWATMYGAHIWVPLSKSDISNIYYDYYVLTLSTGPFFEWEKIKFLFLVGTSMGMTRRTWYMDKTSDCVQLGICDDGVNSAYMRTVGINYTGIIYYKISNALDAGLGIDMISDLFLSEPYHRYPPSHYDWPFPIFPYRYVGIQLSLMYNLNNKTP